VSQPVPLASLARRCFWRHHAANAAQSSATAQLNQSFRYALNHFMRNAALAKQSQSMSDLFRTDQRARSDRVNQM
jgi:hypothetical protein